MIPAARDAPSVESSPKAIDRYQVVRRLGAGGMGVVYLARDLVIDRDVAVKLLRYNDDADARERFAREIRIAGGLAHPNVVRIYDAGDFEGQPFVAMEYVDGRTLDRLIKENEPLPLARKLALMTDLAEALAAAHARGVVHRDIKGSNLIIEAATGRLKVLDFGIARAADTGQTSASVIGTPHFMAPEQIRGEPVDGRCDLFAAGVVLYELIAYRRPFTAENAQAVQYRILNDAPAPLSAVAPGIPPSLDRLVDQLLEKTVARRLPSAQALLDALRDVSAALTSEQTSLTATPADAGRASPEMSAGRLGSDSARRVAELRARQLEELREQARGALTDGRPAAALEAAERALVLDEDDAAAIELAELARKALDRVEAARALSEARRLIDTGSLGAGRQALDLARSRWPTAPGLVSVEQRLLALERAAARPAAAPAAARPAATPDAPRPEGPVARPRAAVGDPFDLVLRDAGEVSPREAPVFAAPPAPPRPSRHAASWLATALALVAAGVLTAFALRWPPALFGPPPASATATPATTTATPRPTPREATSSTPAAPAASRSPAPPPAASLVTIDALPWARVRIVAVGRDAAPPPGPLVTPLAIELPDGEYELSFENGGVTEPLTAHVRVTAGQQNAFRFTMPSFAPAALVDKLLAEASR